MIFRPSTTVHEPLRAVCRGEMPSSHDAELLGGPATDDSADSIRKIWVLPNVYDSPGVARSVSSVSSAFKLSLSLFQVQVRP